jgi:hypothetical protein
MRQNGSMRALREKAVATYAEAEALRESFRGYA